MVITRARRHFEGVLIAESSSDNLIQIKWAFGGMWELFAKAWLYKYLQRKLKDILGSNTLLLEQVLLWKILKRLVYDPLW